MDNLTPAPSRFRRTTGRVLVALFAIYAMELLAFAVLGYSWTDEAWYFNDGVMYSKGYLPYADFFYHRLPITLLPYGAWYKLVGVSLLNGRLLSVLLALSTLRLVVAIAKEIGGDLTAVLAVTLVILNPFASYYLASVSTYACGAFLVTAAVFCFVRTSGSRRWNLALCGFFLALAWGVLYPISQATAWLGLFLLFITYGGRDNSPSPWFGFGGFLAGSIPTLAHVLVSPASAFFSTVTWNFKLASYLREFDVANLDFQTLLRLLVYNQVETFRAFFIIWLFLTPALMVSLWERSRQGTLFQRAAWIARRDVVFMAAIILINEAFYLAAPQSSADQRIYVFPVAACLCGVVLERVWRSVRTHEFRMFFGVTAAVLLCLSLVVQERPRLSLRRSSSDLAALTRVSDRIRHWVPPGERILTFSPAFAGESGRDLVRGIAMEYFSIVPTWSAEQIGSKPMISIEGLRTLIRSQTPGAIVLDQARFFSDLHMGRLMRPYREELLAEIGKTYVLREELDFPRNVYLGTVRIYLPRRLSRGDGESLSGHSSDMRTIETSR